MTLRNNKEPESGALTEVNIENLSDAVIRSDVAEDVFHYQVTSRVTFAMNRVVLDIYNNGPGGYFNILDDRLENAKSKEDAHFQNRLIRMISTIDTHLREGTIRVVNGKVNYV